MRLKSRFKRKIPKKVIICSCVLLLLIIIVIFAPLIAPYDPEYGEINDRLQGPSVQYWCGTDHMGRDIFSRILYGSQVSLFVGITVILITGVIGITIGVLSGYYGGILDAILMRIVDVFLSFPSFLFTLAFAGIFGGGIRNLIIALSIFGWMQYARIVRGEVLNIKHKDFIRASKGMGAGNLYIILRHVIPNIIGPILVVATMSMESIILSAAGLSFLGIGIQPPTPEWGYMLSDGKAYITSAPHIMISRTCYYDNCYGI